MKIRSITYFLNPGWPLNKGALRRAGEFLAAARPALTASGYEVQTVRMATIPFMQIGSPEPGFSEAQQAQQIIALAQALESAVKEMGCDYISLGPALPDALDSFAIIPQVIAATQNVFLSGCMTLPGGGVSLPAVRACAEIIHQAARLSPDGFANLRFAALANVPPGAPFFPAAYHGGKRPAFALAIEAADLAVQAFSRAASLEEACDGLITQIEKQASVLSEMSAILAQRFTLDFGGIDFTLAPYPEEELSFGTALERLGVPCVGLHGSLAAAALLADTLDRALFPRAGFNGLMMPVLEDFTLARRAADGLLTVKDLLLYSAVCGTGLDTVPLPGDAIPDQLNALLLDLASLAQRLDKPLTARLMPIPGKKAGDLTGFDFAYFANSRVMALDAQPLHGVLAGSEVFTLSQRVVHQKHRNHE